MIRTSVGAILLLTAACQADQLNADLSGYRSAPGLTAHLAGEDLVISWNGRGTFEGRLTFEVREGQPLLRELAARQKGGNWVVLGNNLLPEFRVASGLRRMTNQQLDPLAGLGIKITPEILERYKWEAFWDAPLNVPGGDAAHSDCTPPQRGVLDQPGLPRSPEEVKRASASYHATSCTVRTNGGRLEVSFPGVELGVFSGRLQFTVYRGANIVRQEVIATTHEPSVAYKYDAGISGLPIAARTRAAWRDTMGAAQQALLADVKSTEPVTVVAGDRTVALEEDGASIAAFPPPHNFFWARETSFNLGYDWYRKDAHSAAFGVRQAEEETGGQGGEDRRQNFALRSARPGAEQRMPVYFEIDPGPAETALAGASAYTRGDHFAAVPGFQVMATHFHMGLTAKAQRAGGPGAKVPDLEVLRAAGVNIVGPIDGGGTVPQVGAARPTIVGAPGRGAQPDDPKWLQWTRGLGAPAEWVLDQALTFAGVTRADLGLSATSTSPVLPVASRPAGGRGNPQAPSTDPYRSEANYYETAKQQSSAHFVVMANAELLRGEVARDLGGHSDFLLSHPVYWTQGRAPGQSFVEEDSKYGHVYHVSGVQDMIEMAHREHILIYMPHPRSKGSTGFPDAIKDTPHFIDAAYRGIGFRWGMGLDGSEQRLCEYRCLPLWDEMNNWIADKDTPPKYIQAISELYGENYGDDIYANNPVNYVRLDQLPPPGEWGPIVDAMTRGDYFVTSGEVLIPRYAVQRSGSNSKVVADVEWTFPLEFAEVVWGDGVSTGREIVSATDLPPFGKHRFEIPFDARGKKWVRFAVWDSAGEGAMAQPVSLK